MSEPGLRIDAGDPAVLHIGSVAVRLPRRIRSFQAFLPDFILAFLDRDPTDPPGFELMALGRDGTIRWRTPPGRDGAFLPPGWIVSMGDDYACVDADRGIALADGSIVVRL